MLNIKINRDIETNEMSHTIGYNYSSYDIFSNRKEDLSKIVASTALLLINDPLDKTFKSLELQVLSVTEASITYNNDRTIYITYNDRNKQFEMSGLNLGISPQYLRIAFLSDTIVEVPLTC
nr:MAG TPA: hypothetical protein [Caudoviricetes sp.]